MITPYIFIIGIAIAFILLALGLGFQNVFYGIASGILFILIGVYVITNGIYEENGTITNIIEPCNCTNITDARSGESIYGTNTTKTETKSYTQNKELPVGLILVLLGISSIALGLRKDYHY